MRAAASMWPGAAATGKNSGLLNSDGFRVFGLFHSGTFDRQCGAPPL